MNTYTPEEAKELILAGNAPENMRVDGNLYLRDCTNLTSLPKGLNVGWSLDLEGCTNLTSLPEGLNVGGYLDLRGCTSLTSLPEGLSVGRDLGLRGCTGLKGCHVEGVPAIPEIDKKILEALENGGELNMKQWHICETTHCRAGWAIHLAGKDGYALQDRFGAQGAGAMIYLKSAGRMPDFFASGEDALEDIKLSAGVSGG